MSKFLTFVSVICLAHSTVHANTAEQQMVTEAMTSFQNIKQIKRRCDNDERTKKAMVFLLSAAFLRHLANSTDYRNFVKKTVASFELRSPQMVEQIRRRTWQKSTVTLKTESTAWVKGLKFAAGITAILGVIEAVSENNGDVISAKFLGDAIRNTVYGLTGISTVASGTLTDYYLSSEEGFIDFLNQVEPGDQLEYLLTSSPSLAAATIAYERTLNSMTSNCSALGNIKPTALQEINR